MNEKRQAPRTQAGRRLLRWPALQGGVYAISEDILRGGILTIEDEAATIDMERLAHALKHYRLPEPPPGGSSQRADPRHAEAIAREYRDGDAK